MQNITKRAFSLLLALVLCLGVLSGIRLDAAAATVNYQHGTAGSYQNVIKNWGTRGTTATFLSPNAISFYADNNITYSELALLSGSSNTSSVPDSALYNALNELVTNSQTKETSYNDTRELFAYTDIQANGSIDSGAISCFYTGKAIGPEWDSGSTWNREHTWPNSKGDDNGNGENDIMMLRPTSSNVNSSRGNTAYGESSSYYDPNSVSGGTYNLHGDVARILLYVYTRWGTENMWDSSGVIESKEVLLKWMEEDPVDTWEMGRNDSVESITGTRNVYVDYPELAFVLFGEEVPADMTTPSSGDDVVVTPPSYTVTATANSTAYGSVILSGTTITATPATGFYVDGYTVTNGTATVVRSGNVFTVTPTSDCTVQINFAANPVTPVDGVQVMAHNVYFDEYLQIMYAVYVPEDKTIDKIALSDGVNSFQAVLFEDDEAAPVINGKTCVRYVANRGVALQNIDTMVTASIYVDGAVAATDEYSIMQYLHKRLIVGNPSAAQKIMYERLLYAAEKLQIVLNKGTVTLHDTSYVQVINGTVNGKTEAMLGVGATLAGVTPGIVPGDGQQILWTVTTYTDAGVAGTSEVKTTDEVQAMTVQNGVNLVLQAAASDGESGGESGTPITASKTIAALITEYGWTSSTTKQSFNLDSNVSVKIDGGSNTGKAYGGDHIRIYATDSPAGTITISTAEGYELVSVKVTTQTDDTYAFLYVDGTTADICNETVEVSGNSVLLNSVKNGTNGKQVRVTAIEVVYKPVS